MSQSMILPEPTPVLPSSRTRRIAPALKSSVKLRLTLRCRFSSAMVDTVSAFHSVSTEVDQLQIETESHYAARIASARAAEAKRPKL